MGGFKVLSVKDKTVSLGVWRLKESGPKKSLPQGV